MKVTIELSEKNEGTQAPFWLIIDPKQMMKPEPYELAMGMVHGLFFDREEAEHELRLNKHRYSSRAVVWCCAAKRGSQWFSACSEARRKLKDVKN